MRREVTSFITEHELSPFSATKTAVRPEGEGLFKTRDARAVVTKTLNTLSKGFRFSDTASVWHAFPFTTNLDDIKQRQEFFADLKESQPVLDTAFLKNIKKPRPFWKPTYNVIVVTEDEQTFTELQKIECASKYLISPHDVEQLQNYDLVQVIDCDQYKLSLEQLPQSVFIETLDDVYLERFVELLSGWKENLEVLSAHRTSAQINQIVAELKPLLSLIEGTEIQTIDPKELEGSLIDINHTISERMKTMSIGGDALFAMMSKQRFPPEIEQIMRDAIKESGYPLEIFSTSIPITIDEEEVQKRIQLQKANEFTDRAAVVRKHATALRALPSKLAQLETELLLFDFAAGIASYLQQTRSFPSGAGAITVRESRNIFLENAQPISFSLSSDAQCSILTGANSGGKTTLLEHMLQLYILYQLGVPTNGQFETPLFTDIYYFAKNKGSMSKGAFETLLSQMDKIVPNESTLILADEIEAVTEPGVAGKMICATADYFIRQGCFVIIATHLGHEIAKVLPQKARIDGIEAKGLDDALELIVDHNPVLGRLAHSTPELIVEKMAASTPTPYLKHVHAMLKQQESPPLQREY